MSVPSSQECGFRVRVIFDRSAFHGERFDALFRSPLRQRIAQGRIEVYHTPIFIQETLETWGSPRATDAWRAHLEFAADICNGGMFLSRDDIFRGEFFGQPRRLLPAKPTKTLPCISVVLAKMREVALSGDLATEWLDSKAELEDTRLKKTGQRALFSRVRREAMSTHKTRRVTRPRQKYSYAQYSQAELTRNGRDLMILVDERRANELADRWEARPEAFPFYTAFVEGFLYSQYYAEIEVNRPLDKNAQADYEQLAYLVWADLFVSNEGGFLESAFNALWKPKGKRLESAEGFSALLSASM